MTAEHTCGDCYVVEQQSTLVDEPYGEVTPERYEYWVDCSDVQSLDSCRRHIDVEHYGSDTLRIVCSVTGRVVDDYNPTVSTALPTSAEGKVVE